jgi:hypothetical protein
LGGVFVDETLFSMTPAQLETLATVDIATPCPMQWKDLTGDERKRFCASCKQHVYNLEQLDVTDVIALVRRAREERVCLRFYRRLDGTVMTKDCEPAVVVARRIVARHVKVDTGITGTTIVLSLLVVLVTGGVWLFDASARARRAALGGTPAPVTMMATKTFDLRPSPKRNPIRDVRLTGSSDAPRPSP